MYNLVQIVNSFVGRTGNIGQRTGFIVDHLAHGGTASICLARGGTVSAPAKLISMGPLGHFSRLLNAVRIYVNVKFPARVIERFLFEEFVLRNWKKVADANCNRTKILHCWDYLPRVIERAKDAGFKVVLDVPIAPSLFARDLTRAGLLEHTEQELERESERERACFARSDIIIAPSEFVAGILPRYGLPPERIKVIPFGAPEGLASRGDFKRSADHGIDFVFAGAINRRKGIAFLLEAFNDERFRNDRLHLCGRLFREQAKLIRTMKNPRVLLPGVVDTRTYFIKGDVYVFPSLMEGSSKSIYEALAAGMPTITTPNSGSIVRNGIEGLIIEPASSAAIAEGMNYFKENVSKIAEMGQNAVKRAREFTWAAYAARVASVYELLSLGG